MTGYMAEMRKLVGHRTIIQCAASIICVDEKGRLLLGKRSDNHKLGYSGGAIEVDEYVTNVKHFFTLYGKHFLTLYGKEIFTS